MQNINVTVLGHELADPIMWVLYLADRFNQPIRQEVFHDPDRCLVVELTTARYRMVTKAPVHALWAEEDSYRVLLAQPVDVAMYFQSVFVNALHLIQRDFDIVNRLLAAHPTHPPVFTLWNDIFCGKEKGDLLTAEQLNQYRIVGSRVFQTSIRYMPYSETCARGADEVFEALLNVLDEMRT